MHVLVTGNMGYIGPAVIRTLANDHDGVTLTGFDSGFFAHCLSAPARFPESRLDRQVFGDVRHVPEALLDGVDAVVALAAISNDPMGNSFEQVTNDVNYESTVALARQAKARGVRHFVFASSCSIYGLAEGGPRTEQDDVNPLTAYARSKVATERTLIELADDDFTVTCLRFATACGWSDRVRLDLVLNDFVAGALTSGRIHILSDGTPWRPLIVVDDMARAISWAVRRDPQQGGAFLAVNTGSNEWNYQVRDLAKAVAEIVPGTKVQVDEEGQPDKRSYRVNFDLFEQLAPDHQPQVGLLDAIRALHDGMTRMALADRDFRTSNWIRLKVLTDHIDSGRLNKQLEWAPQEGRAA